MADKMKEAFREKVLKIIDEMKKEFDLKLIICGIGPLEEWCREYIQVKWYSIFDDIIYIMCNRNNKY